MSSIQIPAKHRFSVQDVQLMADAGMFAPGERIELLNGELIDMSLILPLHAICVNNLNRLFIQNTSNQDFIVSVQNPIQIDSNTLLEPDLVMARHRRNLMRNEYIQPSDIALLIEVSDTSYAFDSHEKLEAYAGGGVEVYWIVNIRKRQVEAFTSPDSNTYLERKIYRTGFLTPFGFEMIPGDVFPKE